MSVSANENTQANSFVEVISVWS